MPGLGARVFGFCNMIGGGWGAFRSFLPPLASAVFPMASQAVMLAVRFGAIAALVNSPNSMAPIVHFLADGFELLKAQS